MPPHRGEGREDVGTVIKFPSLPRGPRASEGSAFALQNEAARLNGLFFQLPFRPRAEVEWSVVQCARANMHSTCARCGDSRRMADLDSGAQPHCILTADAPPSPEDRFLGGGGRGCIGGGEEAKEGKKEGDRRMNEAEGEFHEYGYERLRPLSARHNVKTISTGFIEMSSSIGKGRAVCQTRSESV